MYTHIPVLLKEVLENAYLPENASVVDGTLGLGGHTLEFVKNFPQIKNYYAFDVDKTAISLAQEKLANYSCVHYQNLNFSEIADFLNNKGINSIDTILLDLGVSSMQLDAPERGFSFRFDAPLSMRLDGQDTDTVAEYINTVDKDELVQVLRELGEESHANKIANLIIENREIKKIETTFELRDIVYRAYPINKRFSKTHPATKTFQALRIAVNGELSHLLKALNDLPKLLSPGGRMMVISFHSLEDRIVKQKFKQLKETGEYSLINKKPIIPSSLEVENNPRSRSSKLRIIEKII